MRIVIDGRMLYWTGVGRYTRALLDELAELDKQNEYVVLTRPADRKLWEPVADNFSRVEVAINPYTVAEQLRLPGIIRALKPDLVHFAAANAPILYGGRRVVTVHDLTLLDYDTSRGTGWRRMVRRLKRPLFWLVAMVNARGAARVLTPTQYVKDEVVRRLGVPAERVVVTLLAADPKMAEPEPLERLGVGKEFLLNIGNVYPYKIGAIVEAMQILAPKYPELKFVNTSRPDYFRDVLMERARELGVADRMVFTGFVSDGELVSLYRQAWMYVYPSVAEGFGLQILEAMGQGCPVLAARRSCLPEIGGEAVAYVEDPADGQELAAAIDALLQDEHKRNELKAAGYKRAKLFSWRRMAEETLAVYEAAKRPA